MSIYRFSFSGVLLAFLFGCQQSAPYHIEASVVTVNGMGILIDAIPLSRADKFYQNYDPKSEQIRVRPVIPGEYTPKTYLPPLRNSSGGALPDSFEIVYQFAKLSGCFDDRSINDSIRQTKDAVDADKNYMTKYKCANWEPIPGTKRSQIVSLEKLKDSDEVKKWGRRNASGYRLRGVLVLDFLDNSEIRVRAETRTVNPWK